MMRLLASSSAILVEGRYPYESNRLQQILAAANPGDAEHRWREAAGALLAEVRGGQPASVYAEKVLDARRLPYDSLPGSRMIVLLRDPRDTLVSITAFSRAVGRDEMGGGRDREEMLARFVRRQRSRLRWISSLAGDGDALVVRYGDLVERLPDVAERLGAWLGVVLDPADVARDFRLRWVHGTSPDPRRSLGRWESELDAATVARLERELGPELRVAGFS